MIWKSAAAVVCGLAALALLPAATRAIDNGLGSLPGLGWNSDYCTACANANVDSDGVLRGFQNEKFVKHIADYLNSSGFQALGYRYVNMDASWNLPTRDAAGNMMPDPALWPSGLATTVDYVHSLGLGFGLYGDRGTLDCAKNPGNLGHETQDAAYYAATQIDWYKSDSCYSSGDHATAFADYGKMRDALNATGRPIWFALCGWNAWYAPVGRTIGNSWRVGVDTGGGWLNVLENVNAMLSLASYAGPGGWNDMSLLLNPGMGSGDSLITPERHRSQFTLHCIFGANMLMTGNLSALSPYALETWGNAEAVAVNQDPATHPFVVLPVDAVVVDGAAPAAGYQVAQVQECGGEVMAQNWTFGAPAASFLQNSGSGLCLNVEACGTTIIYDGCKTTGGTCSGPDSYLNEQWRLAADGALLSLLPSGLCATVAANGSVGLAACESPLPAAQQWTYLPASGELQAGGGLCLTVPPPPAPPSNTTTLLVGRRLAAGGAWALAALNNLPGNASITCGAACFAAMGFAPSDRLTVRDLWAHADVGVTPATSYAVRVAGGGASALLKFTPLPPA